MMFVMTTVKMAMIKLILREILRVVNIVVLFCSGCLPGTNLAFSVLNVSCRPCFSYFHELKRKKQGAVTYSTDQKKEV